MACPCTTRVRHLPGRVLERLFGNNRLFTVATVVILVLSAGQACKTAGKPAAPITITLIDQNWPDYESRRNRNEQFRRFTNETGIRVEVLPSPETVVDQLIVWRKLLDSRTAVPDVYAVDLIWPAKLSTPSGGPFARVLDGAVMVSCLETS